MATTTSADTGRSQQTNPDKVSQRAPRAEAREWTGGLSTPSKVGAGYSIPTTYCITGSKLRGIPNTVCAKCYAHERGRYTFPNVKAALQRRYETLYDPKWIDGMVILIGKKKYFRWHDSGDLQSLKHLDNIVEVCKRTPGTKHWLPTKEWDGLGTGKQQILERWLNTRGELPKNLCVRKSMFYINEDPPPGASGQFSSSTDIVSNVTCPSTLNGKSCDENECHKCWDRRVRTVRYKMH